LLLAYFTWLCLNKGEIVNRFKVFVLCNVVWQVVLFCLSLPLIANLFGAIPVLVYSLGMAVFCAESDSYLRALLKSAGTFALLGVCVGMESTMAAGMLMSSLAILVSVLLCPYIINSQCKVK
jgi:hypothetical protein